MNRKSKIFSAEKVLSMCDGSSYSLEQIQKRLLEMMTKFDIFCKEHGIRYFLAGGTLLGAVRHKGFIPWDDDVDILVPRADYEKLLTFDCIDENLDIVSYKKPGKYYHPYPYCNIADRRTVMYEHNTKCLTGKGLFLDIFPLDFVPENDRERKKFYRKLIVFRYLKGLPMNPYRKIRTLKDICMNICSFILGGFDEIKMTKRIDELASMYQNHPSSMCAALFVGPLDKLTWKTFDYAEVLRTKFEDKEFDIPVNYDEVLTVQYGDYMTPPPVSEQAPHHGVDVFDRK